MVTSSGVVSSETKKLKAFLVKELKSRGVKITETSRHGFHLRAEIGDSAESLLNEIIPCTISSSPIQMSKSYKTQVIHTLKQQSGIPKGTELIYVETKKSSGGILKTKQFTPDSLGFGGNDYSPENLYKALKESIPKFPEGVQALVSQMIETAWSGDPKIDATGVHSSDINALAKDFGELTGALWMMRHAYKNASSVKFPKESNSALVDYHISLKDETVKSVSAKAGVGAAPSLTSVSMLLKDGIIVPKSKDKKVAEFIESIKDLSGLDAITHWSRELKTPGWKEFDKLGVSLRDWSSVERWIGDNLNSWDTTKTLLSNGYRVMNRWPSDDGAEKMFRQNAPKKNGLILSPLGYHMIDVINNTPGWADFLTDSLNSLETEQVYMDLTAKSVKYSVKKFSKSKFAFHFDSNINNAANKKISFKMKK